MSDSKVIGLVTKEKIDKEQNIKELLVMVDNFRKIVEQGKVEEFVLVAATNTDDIVTTTSCYSIHSALGILEIAKAVMIHQQ